MKDKKLRVVEQTETGLNIGFINRNTGRTIGLEQAIQQIEKGNPSYGDYVVVRKQNGTTYIRSKPDGYEGNNIEQ